MDCEPCASAAPQKPELSPASVVHLFSAFGQSYSDEPARLRSALGALGYPITEIQACVLGSLGKSGQTSPVFEDFKLAQQLVAKKDYRAAASAYRKLADAHFHDEAVWNAAGMIAAICDKL